MKIDAKNMHYKELNNQIRELIRSGTKEIEINNVNGQRYIGDNIGEKVKIIINGIPGQDLAFSMDGPELIINANAQDGVGNTMSSGKIVIHGNAGDICGYAMRGGKIFIKGNVGYRSGIHMKEYKDFYPIIVVGGYAGDFFGEYMAGGVLVVLGLHSEEKDIIGNFCATGMHGGRIFVRGDVPDWKLGKEIKKKSLDDQDKAFLSQLLDEYKRDMQMTQNISLDQFIKIEAGTSRPYGRLYAY